MFGKTTTSSSGTSSNVLKLHHPSLVATAAIVASRDEVNTGPGLFEHWPWLSAKRAVDDDLVQSALENGELLII
jgi:hypothetical protein